MLENTSLLSLPVVQMLGNGRTRFIDLMFAESKSANLHSTILGIREVMGILLVPLHPLAVAALLPLMNGLILPSGVTRGLQ